jgi:hypothetical protein
MVKFNARFFGFQTIRAQSYFLRQLMQRLDTLVNPRTNVERVCPVNAGGILHQ